MKSTCGKAGGLRMQRVPALPASAGTQTGNVLWKQCCSTAEVIDSLFFARRVSKQAPCNDAVQMQFLFHLCYDIYIHRYTDI